MKTSKTGRTPSAFIIVEKGLILSTLLLISFSGLSTGLDVTFFVTTDLHYDFENPDTHHNKAQIEAMNGIPGISYPPEIGGIVDTPLGVLIAGDLTHHGAICEWDSLAQDYGLADTGGLLNYPCYECSGNHDSSIIRMKIAERHGSLTYSWSWQSIYVISLDVYPTVEYSAWLAQELETIEVGRPVILFHHYGFDSFSLEYWSDEERESYRDALTCHNIIGIFHGHHHGSLQYRWENFDVYSPLSTMGLPTLLWGAFLVVHLTDSTSTVADYLWEMNENGQWIGGYWRWTHQKSIYPTIRICTQCPDDHIVPGDSTESWLVLQGFSISNVDSVDLSFNYYLSAQGPATLADNGDSTSLSGMTPLLGPGESYSPPEAALEIPEITEFAQETITYHVSAVQSPDISDSCKTVITFESPATAAVTKNACSFVLHQNHPNPFNSTTCIPFVLDQRGSVTLSIYDASGTLVRTLIDQRLRIGTYLEEWDGRDTHGEEVASGIYFYRLKVDNRAIARKAVFLK